MHANFCKGYPTSACTYANCEGMMQYHEWDINIILTLDDTLPFHNNFCSHCIQGNPIKLIVLPQVNMFFLFAVECTGAKDCREITYLPKLQINSCGPHLEHSIFFPFWNLFDTPFYFLIMLTVAVFQHWLAIVFFISVMCVIITHGLVISIPSNLLLPTWTSL